MSLTWEIMNGHSFFTNNFNEGINDKQQLCHKPDRLPVFMYFLNVL